MDGKKQKIPKTLEIGSPKKIIKNNILIYQTELYKDSEN